MKIFQRNADPKNSDQPGAGEAQSIVAERLADIFSRESEAERKASSGDNGMKSASSQTQTGVLTEDAAPEQGKQHPQTPHSTAFAARDAVSLLENSLQLLQQRAAEQVAEGLEKIAHDLLNRSSKQLEQQADTAAGAWQKRLGSLTEASLQALVKATTEECRGLLAQMAQEQSHAVRREAEAAAGSINVATKEAIAQLQAAQEAARASFQAAAGENEKRLTELASNIEKLQHKADGQLEDHLQQSLQGLQHKAIQEIKDQLERIAQDLLTSSTQQAQHQAETTAAAWQKQLASLTETSLQSLVRATTDECRAQLAQMSQEKSEAARHDADVAANSIKQAASEASAQLRTAEQSAESNRQNFEETQKRLAELSSSVEKLQHNLDERFQSSHQLLQQKSADLAHQLETIAQDLLNRTTQQAQQQANAAAAAWQKQLASLTEVSLQALVKATTDECRGRVAQVFQEQAELLGGTRTER